MKLKFLFPLIATFTIAGITSANAQVSKSGGLFGFKKKGEQLSSDLFPQEEVSAEEQALQQATNISSEEDSKKKKGGLFPFGKKADDTSGRPAISPTPVETTEPAESGQTYTESVPQFEVKDDKKKGVSFPFFKKDKDSTTEELQSIASNPIYNSPEMVVTETENETVIRSNAGETSEGTEETINNAPVPDFVGSTDAQKDEEGGIFSRMSMPKIPKKKTDYVEVETVMKDGEFIKDDAETSFSADPTLPSPSNGESKAPEIINGVKVYSSWDDVEASSVSEADRIINNIR